MLSILISAIVLLTIVGIVTKRFLNVLPIIIILGMFTFFTATLEIIGWLFKNPLILLIVIIFYLLTRKNRKKQSRAKFYYYSSGQGSGQNPNFEEFFRQAGSGYSGYSNSGYGGAGLGGSRTTTFNTREEAFEILGVKEGATKEEIKRAFREKAKLHHPDKFANAPKEELEKHEKEFQKINESYEYLMKDFN